MKKLFLIFAITALFLSSSYGQQNNQSIRKVSMAMYAIQNLYVDKVDDDKLSEDAIEGILSKLDPHSSYMTPEETKEMNEPLQGNFDGIGVQFNMLTDTLYIVQVISGGPSEKVGIHAGDRIILVDDTLIAGVKMKNTDIMKRLRGPKGTSVRVKILRQNQPDLIEFNITRDKIPIYSLDASYMIDKETGYIRLNRFAATSRDEFVKALKDLQTKGMKNLIFDLQGNGGGYLNAAIEISDEFLGQGKTVVYTEGLRQRREDELATGKGNFENGKIIMLIDESSASASEIVTGAVQDWDRGLVVGRRSFGKGLVQRPIPLPDGSMIRLTTARYYTPTGRCIQKPYESGKLESYNKDLVQRYNRGEMVSADSIHFPDSLKYNTLQNKRIVYGGGGIMPDYFVPLDTMNRLTPIHSEILSKGIINRYVLGLVDRNRESYKKTYKTFESFASRYTITDDMLQDLIKMTLDDRKSPTTQTATTLSDKEKTDFIKSKSILSLQIKALVARDLWNDTEYYRVINDENDALKKAIQLMNSPAEYNKLLGLK